MNNYQGTCAFVSYDHAVAYYRQYTPYESHDTVRQWVNDKITNNEIVIGEPTIKDNQKLIVVDNGCRYAIVDKQPKE
jgi:hypothetical protein